MADPLETTNLPATVATGSAVADRIPLGVMPTTLEDAWRLAQLLAKSGLVPEDFRGRPENVLVALQLGAEVGFPPMQALQSIAVINGRPTIWGDGLLALITSSRPFRAIEEWYEVAGERRAGLAAEDWKHDESAAVCAVWRTDREGPFVSRFSVGQARKAGLLQKKGPWQDYPDRMLKLRARSWAARDAFPDVLRGLVAREEAMDMGAPLEREPVAPLQPRRASARLETPPSASTPASDRSADSPAAAVSGTAPEPPAAATPRGRTIRGVRIEDTAFMRPKEPQEPYFLIVAKTSTGRPMKLRTQDERLYHEAASFEGTESAVTITVESDGAELVLTALEIYDGPPLTGGEASLFPTE